MFLLISLFSTKLHLPMKEKISIRLFWDMKPKIVLCDDAKVSKFNLSQAISFWNGAGYGVSTEIIEKSVNLITYLAKFVSRAKGIWIYKNTMGLPNEKCQKGFFLQPR